MAALVLLQGGEAIPYALSQGETVLGRHPDCGIQLDSNMVSRRHAQVTGDGDQFFVEDLGSGNGTIVNGKQIEKRTLLKHGDRIKLGPVLLRFESQAEAQKPVGLGATDSFTLNITADEVDAAQFVGSSATESGFGVLEVQPEAKLKAILEISRALAGTVDLPSLLPKMLDTLFRIFPHADRGSILLKDLENNRMIPAAQKHRRAETDDTVKLSRTILKKVLEEKTGILSADAASDARFDAAQSISDLTIRSMMCVPLLGLDHEPIGVIHVDTANPLNQFKKDDLDLLMAVAGQAALSYEGARLMQSYLAKQKQDNEMQIAQAVQQAMLPETLPEVDGYEFYASYDSAQAVGGDYYDCFKLGDDKICVSFGDVAGKGVPGALIMSRMATVVQNTLSFTQDVNKAIATINNMMCAKAVEGRFVTYVLAIVDVRRHEMTLVNAGHASPLVRKTDGSVDAFNDDVVGLPIGILEDYDYEVVSRRLEPGEIVVITTDGVDEAMNPAGELYTKERVVEFVGKAPARAAELGRALLADVRRHANGRPQNDDITIMTFGRNPQ
jgi:serine phosphatase RsbU (regulator of sigma subunit)